MAERPSHSPLPFEALVEQALVGVYVVQDDRFVYANPRLAQLFGYSPSELLALPSIDPLIDPADRAAVHERLRLRLTGQVATSTHVMRGRRRDGSLVEVEVYSTSTEHDGRPAVTGTMIDATERRGRERDLEARERRYRDLIENAVDMVYTCDLEGQLTSLNAAGERITGYGAAEVIGRPIADFVPVNQRALIEELLRRQIRDRRDFTHEFEILTRDGTLRVLEVSTRIIASDGRPTEFQGIARDVTGRKEQELALRSLTTIDDLTKLYNRRGFLTLAERHLKLAVRKKAGVSLLFADLDGLKKINDTCGHLEGDRALVAAADVLRHSFRSADIIARLGGDEFTVFPIEAAAGSGQVLIARLEEQIRRNNDANPSRPWRLGLSVGIARIEPDTSWTIDRLLEIADQALYEQKRERKAR